MIETHHSSAKTEHFRSTGGLTETICAVRFVMSQTDVHPVLETRPALVRSVLSVLGGFSVVVVLSIGTDMALIAAGLFPDFTKPGSFTTPMLLAATIYRTAFGVIGGTITAHLAPRRAIKHALILGALGFVVSVAGAVTMWDAGPNWYPIALVVLAIPAAWAGGRLQSRWRART